MSSFIGIGIMPTDVEKLQKEWQRLLSIVKTKEDFDKLPKKEKELFIACNTMLAPSFSLKPSKST